MVRYRGNRNLNDSDSNNSAGDSSSEPLGIRLVNSLEENIKKFKEIFKNDETLIFRHFENQYVSKIKGCIIFIDGMINADAVNESIINPVVSNNALNEQVNLIDILKNKVIISNDISKTSDIDKLVEAIISGDTVLLLEDFREALMINSKGWQSRGIVEPETEKVLRGPREGFNEAIMVNLSLIRRKLKTPDLKFQFKTIGKRTKTRACICYIDGIVNPKIIDELNTRLDKIDIDGVLDTGYIQELIRDSRFSPFRTVGTTERPDVIVGKMLEGRVALILDGTPIALTVPFIFVELFQSSDDYYNNYYFTSVSRIIRIISFLITVSVPALYLALITFHQELIPTDLLISISAARQGIPFPTIIEALSLLVVFEILRETGTRMPTYIGQALSIVGALVLGTAAVDARFVSAPMVIIIGLSGITGLMTPKVKGAVILMRIMLMLLASFLGLYGVVFGVSSIIIHLFNIRSFGVMYMSGVNTSNFKDIKDTAIRAPWWYMTYRPTFASQKNQKRQQNGGK